MANLLLCVSQVDNQTPYVFKITNTKVFSLEETLFHVYYNWKNTADELFTPAFTGWVRDDLRLPEIAHKINAYADDPFDRRLIAFLQVIDYFDDYEINSLRAELAAWAKRVEWEKLKDRGDYLTTHGAPEKAVAVYLQALDGSRQARLLNNLAVALTQLERYGESAALLNEAMGLEPDNDELKLNYAEARLYAGKAGEAREILDKLPPSEPVFILLGEIYGRAGETDNALMNFKAAVEAGGSDASLYRLAEFYVEQAAYDKAVSTINRVKAQDAQTAFIRAGICRAQSDFPSAAEILEKALATWPNDVALWLALSECGRDNMDLKQAEQAVAKALSLQPDNARAQLELVKVKRAQNKVREYREALRRLIDSLKNEYRDAGEAV